MIISLSRSDGAALDCFVMNQCCDDINVEVFIDELVRTMIVLFLCRCIVCDWLRPEVANPRDGCQYCRIECMRKDSYMLKNACTANRKIQLRLVATSS